MSSLENFKLSLRVSIALISEHLLKITTAFPLSAFSTTFSYSDKCLGDLNSEGVRFSGGSRSLEKFWCEVGAASSSLALKSDFHLPKKFVLFTWLKNV